MIDLRFCLPSSSSSSPASLWSRLLSVVSINLLSKSFYFANRKKTLHTMDWPVHISKAWSCEVEQLWTLGQIDECLQSHLWRSCIRGDFKKSDLFQQFKKWLTDLSIVIRNAWHYSLLQVNLAKKFDNCIFVSTSTAQCFCLFCLWMICCWMCDLVDPVDVFHLLYRDPHVSIRVPLLHLIITKCFFSYSKLY